MAGLDQVVCPFFGVVFERLKNLIYKDKKEHGPLVGLVKDLKKLIRTLFKIKQVLSDAEEKQFNNEEEAVRFWLQELNDAAYEADDVFDEFEYEALQQLASEGGSSSSNNVIEQLHGKIQNLIEIFQDLAKECSELDLRKGKEKKVVISPDRISISLLTEPQVYGRGEDKEKLVKQLLGSDYFAFDQYGARISKHPRALRGPVLNSGSSQDNISVFPILGMGGLGKTTLAQLVYNDKRVENHFEVRSWVCVSDNFDIKRLVKAFLASVSGSECDVEDIELLQRRLQKEVHGKRFLLVLDDVWEERKDEWNKMMKFFEGGAQGSSIMVTTRLPTVASFTSTSTLPPHCPNNLSKRDGWALFKQYAFGPGNEEKPTMRKIGKEIMKKCGGIPLAVKTLGGLLRFKSDENEWLSIKDSKIWDFDNTILPSLRLSYYHLSFMLKQCFVYCSIFPKDYEIEKEQLIQLWMANGLVQSRAEFDLEDVGNAIFNELLWRSFFQDIKKHEDGNVISCKMHDLVHDLASYIAGDEYFVEDAESSRSPTQGTRHVSLQFRSSNLESSPRLRSLVRSKYCSVTLKAEFVFSDFILLRALDLNCCQIKVVPNCIGEMKHLRYLNLSWNRAITSLPESICLLRNMQTLSLGGCDKLSSLPEHIENMRCLIHLDIGGCNSLTSMPVGIGQLAYLRTLLRFIVGKVSGSGVDGLQKLNNLRGELCITGLDVVETLTKAKEANLMSKKNIHSLSLRWDWGSDSDSDSDSRQQRDQNVIEGLQPHSNLRKLEIEGYKGVTLSPSWLTEEASLLLPNLVQISLSACPSCEHLGSLTKLPRLKILKLLCLNSLKFIEEEVVDDADAGGGFPSLEELSLKWMPNLQGWSSSLSSSQASATVFPCLRSVRLEDCPKLKGGIPLASSPVQHVYIDDTDSSGMVLGSLRDLPYLLSLRIYWYGGLDFPSGTLTNLTALHNLEISYCSYLKALPVELKSLATLTELEISHCARLVSLAEEREGGLKSLSSLKTLVIMDCQSLKCLPELEKASLVTLRINNCPEMEFSKEDFEHLVVLEQLELIDLPKLTCFPAGIKHSAATLRHVQFRPNYGAPVDLPDWIGTTLASLEYLAIVAPENWNVLPQWMQHFTALKELKILCGEELVEQWRNRDRQREEDNSFSMIAHIPHVDLY